MNVVPDLISSLNFLFQPQRFSVPATVMLPEPLWFLLHAFSAQVGGKAQLILDQIEDVAASVWKRLASITQRTDRKYTRREGVDVILGFRWEGK